MPTKKQSKPSAKARSSSGRLVRRPRLVQRCYYTQSRELRDGYWSGWNCDSPHFTRKNEAERQWESRREWLATGTHYVPKQSRLVYGIFDYRHGEGYKLTRRVLRRCFSPNNKLTS